MYDGGGGEGDRGGGESAGEGSGETAGERRGKGASEVVAVVGSVVGAEAGNARGEVGEGESESETVQYGSYGSSRELRAESLSLAWSWLSAASRSSRWRRSLFRGRGAEALAGDMSC